MIFDFYLIKKWLTHLAIIFLLFFLIILFIDFIDISKSNHSNSINNLQVLKIALLRNYNKIQNMNHFVILLTNVVTFALLCQRREYIAAITMGKSHLTILRPAITMVVLYYLVTIFIFNPIYSYVLNILNDPLSNHKNYIELGSNGVWFREDNNYFFSQSHTIFINAKKMADNAHILQNLHIFCLDEFGRFVGKVITEKMIWQNGIWYLDHYKLVDNSGVITNYQNGYLRLKLVPEKIIDSMVAPEFLGLWKTLDFIDIIQKMAIPTLKYQLYVIRLLLAIFLYLAMSLIAYSYTIYVPRLCKSQLFFALMIGFALHFIVEISLISMINHGVTTYLSGFISYGIFFLLSLILFYKKCLNYQKSKISSNNYN